MYGFGTFSGLVLWCFWFVLLGLATFLAVWDKGR
jgi:hypothetical protein